MEEEIEDTVGDVKLVTSDSQRSVATSYVYSIDFTDSSSDKNNSSGKDTYVIEHYDSDDSDLYPIHDDKSVIDLKEIRKIKEANVQCEVSNIFSRATANSVHSCIFAQEMFTQTSKTIFELAQTDGIKETLETQTSFISITENKTFNYRIAIADASASPMPDLQNVKALTDSLENESSKQESESEIVKFEDNDSETSSEDRIIYLLDTDSKDNVLSEEHGATQYDSSSDSDEAIMSDIEQDSLMEIKRDSVEKDNLDNSSDISDIERSIDGEIEELYNKLLTEKYDAHADVKTETVEKYRSLTPLTEESTIKRDSLIDFTNEVKEIEASYTNVPPNDAGDKVTKDAKEHLKLPPIQRSRPNSPHLNFLFSMHPANKTNKLANLSSYDTVEKHNNNWVIESNNFAGGECPLVSKLDGGTPSNSFHLPPIHIEAFVMNKVGQKENVHSKGQHDAICIKNKIGDLKMAKRGKSRMHSKYNMSSDSRSASPSSGESPDDKIKLCDAAERGCDALCIELLRRLKSNSWFEVSDTLEEIPSVLVKFWEIIPENRIADLIRQVSVHIESPRTQVARVACNTLAAILKNTNYTKKPDFNEAMTLLLSKTGSFSRPVRRAANVALDAVVCGVDLTHSVTALSIHGVEHKSPLVRCAAARLLVVSCAVRGAGRTLLRARPPSAASARRHTLRALAALLDDKDTHARKYAERLYAMLRPLCNFEAYYLTDVEVELASRQMKKYDRLLICTPTRDASFQKE